MFENQYLQLKFGFLINHDIDQTSIERMGAAKIDEALNNRVTRANIKNGHTK